MVVSSEMPELIGICDRILVMSNGRVAGILDMKKDYHGQEQEESCDWLQNTFNTGGVDVEKKKFNLNEFLLNYALYIILGLMIIVVIIIEPGFYIRQTLLRF